MPPVDSISIAQSKFIGIKPLFCGAANLKRSGG